MNTEEIKKNKACPQCIKHSFCRRGFALLFAVTISAILLAIALGVENITLKEVQFSTSAKDTNDAFFASDTGFEYAIFKDEAISTNYPAGVKTSDYMYGLGTTGKGCALITVDKTTSSQTKVVSKGYNSNIGSVGSCKPSSNSVEREIDVTY